MPSVSLFLGIQVLKCPLHPTEWDLCLNLSTNVNTFLDKDACWNEGLCIRINIVVDKSVHREF